jgi:uncharacterized phiE125 gp8 family phage protein
MLETLAAPSVLPVSLATIKGWLRETTADWDADLTDLARAAFEHAEMISGNAIVYRPVREQYDGFPSSCMFELTGYPVRGVQSIRYLDTAGAWQTLPAANYRVDITRGAARITPEYGLYFPPARLVMNSVQVTYDIGLVCPVAAVDDVGNTITIPGHNKAAGDRVQLYTDGGTMPGGVTAAQAYYALNPNGDALQISATSAGAAVDVTPGYLAPVFLGTIPEVVRQALRLILNTWADHQADITLLQLQQLPVHGVEALLAPLRPRGF